jgi:hypothetical protein
MPLPSRCNGPHWRSEYSIRCNVALADSNLSRSHNIILILPTPKNSQYMPSRLKPEGINVHEKMDATIWLSKLCARRDEAAFVPLRGDIIAACSTCWHIGRLLIHPGPPSLVLSLLRTDSAYLHSQQPPLIQECFGQHGGRNDRGERAEQDRSNSAKPW